MMLKKAVFLTSVMLWGSTEAFTLLLQPMTVITRLDLFVVKR